MIRGAIAFALVMKIPYVGSEKCDNPEYCYTKEQYDLAVSTCLMLVFITTLIFGTFMKLYQVWMLGTGPEVQDHHSEHSHYMTINHPNLEKEADDPACVPSKDPNAPKGFNEYAIVKWFNDQDANILRPYFIRKYDPAVMDAQEEYHEMMAKNFDDSDIDSISQRLVQLKSAKKDSESGHSVKEIEMRMSNVQFDALKKGGKLKKTVQ